ncbi:MAG: type II/IV secretion system protein [Bacteroidales bacterium]|nr:type II/IV secretion system protein [Bacteroidales bacterium]
MIQDGYILISTELQQTITAEQAWHYHIIPQKAENNLLSFYISDSELIETVKDELELLFGKSIELEKTDSEIISKSLGKYYRKKKPGSSSKATEFTAKSEDFLINLITEANETGSSDIHIESYEERCRVRMRIDGKLIERYVLKKEDYPAIINKIKIKANLDIAEKRLPQDGRIFFHTDNEKFDIRVSVLPTLYGEKVVLRLLSKDATDINIEYLGMNPDQLKNYTEGIKKPHGIILISGPTGSGKTTTLYATLKILNKEYSNIVTIEDPIEYTLEGINQVQLKESIGLTFASALRTFLRQDPDVIMLGEIRDGETAKMAVRAALTGHLVLSTIHTNSAWGTISRLIDMGVPPFLVASTLNLSVAQRLVRMLCPECKEKHEFDPELYPRNYIAPSKLKEHFTANGCEACYYTGYKGRKAVYEIIPIDHELADNIKAQNIDENEIEKMSNFKTLSGSAFELFERGDTSIEEIYSILINS